MFPLLIMAAVVGFMLWFAIRSPIIEQPPPYRHDTVLVTFLDEFNQSQFVRLSPDNYFLDDLRKAEDKFVESVSMVMGYTPPPLDAKGAVPIYGVTLMYYKNCMRARNIILSRARLWEQLPAGQKDQA